MKIEGNKTTNPNVNEGTKPKRGYKHKYTLNFLRRRRLQKIREEGSIGGVVFREREGLWDNKWSRGAVQDNIYEQRRHIRVGKGDDSGEGEERRRESKFAIGGGGEAGTKAMIINSYGLN